VIECECESQAQPNVIWLHETKPLVGDRRYLTEITKTQANRFRIILEINDPKKPDAGIYKCLTKNDNGSTVVYIEFKPDGRQQLIHVLGIFCVQY
jgi:hypothetical protein